MTKRRLGASLVPQLRPEVTRVCLFHLQTMALPLNAWQKYSVHQNYRASATIPTRLQGFGGPAKAPPSKRAYAPLKGKLGTKGLLAAAGMLPAMAGLGALIGRLVNKKTRG